MTSEMNVTDLACGICGAAGCAACDAELHADTDPNIAEEEVLWPESDDPADDEIFINGDDEVLWPGQSTYDSSEDEPLLDDEWGQAHDDRPSGGSIVEALAAFADF